MGGSGDDAFRRFADDTLGRCALSAGGAPRRRQVATLPAGIYRYDPRRHQLASTALGDRLPGLAAAALHQSWIADAPAVHGGRSAMATTSTAIWCVTLNITCHRPGRTE